MSDWKPKARVKDPDVYTRFHQQEHTCLACGNRHVTAAHLLRGTKREDDIRGLIPLCGDGTRRCHGVFDNGGKYRGDFGHEFTQQFVRDKVARHIRSEAGDDARAYLEERLGPFGPEWYCNKLEGGAEDG